MANICGVYGIFASDSGECLYIGESTRITMRWSDHLSALISGKHVRSDFALWFKERGSNPELLDFRVLEECEPEKLGSIEKVYFDLHKPRFFGQIPHANRQWFLTEETRAKLSIRAKQRSADPEYITIWEQTVNIHGRDRAVELTSPGRFNGSQERAVKAGKGNTGTVKSEVHRAKISSALIGQANPATLLVNKDSLKAAILEAPTNLSVLADNFGVSRPTVRKYIKNFELTELLAENFLSPYSLAACPGCEREIANNSLKRHMKGCISPMLV